MNFKDFKFKSRLAYAISRAGFTEPSPIQEKTIPLILEGKDVVGQAHTGTGKTAAFALPILQKMTGKDGVEAVIIVPTRELASQVADEFYKFSRNLKIRTATIYGGTSYKRQIMHIENAGVIVATPGRFLDLLSREKINIKPKYVVLDEADEMLNMGFLEDIRRIFTYFEDREQTLMFSATMSEEIKDLSKTILKNPEFIRTEEEAITNNNIKQYYYVVEENERDAAIIRLIESSDPDKAIIFCRTKKETDRLAEFLSGQGYKVEALHGDMEQWDRQKTMKGFRRNEYEILVATDVASRGLDVRGVSHIFNYHIPFESESYVHRIGRTGRAKQDGVAMMLVTPNELYELQKIQKDVGSELVLKSIPQKDYLIEDQLKNFFTIIENEKLDKSSKIILDLLLKKDNIENITMKLISLLGSRLQEKSLIGKTIDEVQVMISELNNNVLNTKSKKLPNGKLNRKTNRQHKGQLCRGKRRYENTEIRRGTSRGEIPEPTITRTSGGDRIIARKLY